MMGQPNEQSGIRRPAVAGQFYPAQPEALRDALQRAFRDPLGPGALPEIGAGPRRVFGIIAPHAGYPYAAQGAAWGYAAAARDGRPALAVLLGVNHRGIGAPLALSPARGWQTPLGVAPLDHDAQARLRTLDPALTEDARAHQAEHSLEVHVPFLQRLYGALPIVPILLGHLGWPALERLATALATLARERDTLCIASTDFSHYLPHPEATARDARALACIAELAPERLLDTVRDFDISMCGVLPVAALLLAARQVGDITARILHYHTSGDVLGDRREVVGYGTVVLTHGMEYR